MPRRIVLVTGEPSLEFRKEQRLAVALSKIIASVRKQEISEEGMARLRAIPGVAEQLPGAAMPLSTAQKLVRETIAWQQEAGLQRLPSQASTAIFQFFRFFEVFLFFLLIWYSDCFGGVLWYFGGFPGFYRFLLFSTFFCGLVRFGAFFFRFFRFFTFFIFFLRFGAFWCVFF